MFLARVMEDEDVPDSAHLEIRKSVSDVKLKLKGIGFSKGSYRAMSVHDNQFT